MKAKKPQMTEAQWQKLIKELAEALGWMHYHTYDSRRSEPGFPDDVLLHPIQRRVIFAELKTDTGRVSSEQKRWLLMLRQSGQAAYVWRPKHYQIIVRILKGEIHPQETMEVNRALD